MKNALRFASILGCAAFLPLAAARAEPASPDFRLGGAGGQELRAASLFATDGAASAGQAGTGSLGMLSAIAPVAVGADDGGKKDSFSYIAVRGGPLFFIGDLEDLGTGFTIEGAFGIQPIRFLAIEIQSGYFRGEDDSGTIQGDLWGIPLVVNVKLVIPILFLNVYGGLGAGGYYIQLEAENGAVDDDEDDFVFGGNAFVGVDIDLGPVFVGVEGKYILTTDVDGPAGTNFNLEGFAAMAVVGIRL